MIAESLPLRTSTPGAFEATQRPFSRSVIDERWLDGARPGAVQGQAPDLATIDLLVREGLERLEDDMSAARRYLAAARRLLSPDDACRPGGLLPWQVRRVGRYIDERIERRITLAEAADQVRLSTSHFSRCFRISFGSPFTKYVTRKRIERARWLMITGDQSLGQIALTCGFADQAHFTRAFTHLTGEAPGRWRRQVTEVEPLDQ
ncbi:AraC family transcriptional regulator [Caulobacter sp. CCNWLY153]|uniref:AraC family transcriptional regulator n=2 Tax=Caulobacter TaxID=75 RepID=A0A2T9JB29_9CAUL|nr:MULTISPECIES: AraC family transcriptional regulator [Caulobacter]NGM49363.1 helix-turn-helix transcriptional regulator [Caulobacter sp. 602-2]PVM79430.1 AraC family transcriptional regulator [Caulobacter radicis]